jgi:ketol-acid reductoisomerase
MAKIYYDADADLELVRAKKIGVVGYGSQGHAHALNLRDSGVNVRVATGARSKRKAEADGFAVVPAADLAKWADVIMLLTPDTSMPEVFNAEMGPNLSPGNMVMFSHGFNIRYRTIVPPKAVDVTMIAPKGPGHRLRELFVDGGGIPSLIAVHQDATGQAKALALSYACGIGATRAGVLETTFDEETETDLFGEQAVLCGGASALVKAGFQTLVDAGYQPEIAYFECLHELKLIVDLMYQGGLTYMRYSVSDTAENGDYTAGPKIVTDATREAMKQILADVRSGAYAKKWIEENRQGRPTFNRQRAAERELLIEKVGAKLRSMMPFLNPVTIPADESDTVAPS